MITNVLLRNDITFICRLLNVNEMPACLPLFAIKNIFLSTCFLTLFVRKQEVNMANMDYHFFNTSEGEY